MDAPTLPAVQRLYEEIGQRVRDRRQELGWRQDDVARLIGLSRASVANLETGRQRLLAHQVFEIAAALDMSPAELFGFCGRNMVRRDVIQIKLGAAAWPPVGSQ